MTAERTTGGALLLRPDFTLSIAIPRAAWSNCGASLTRCGRANRAYSDREPRRYRGGIQPRDGGATGGMAFLDCCPIDGNIPHYGAGAESRGHDPLVVATTSTSHGLRELFNLESSRAVPPLRRFLDRKTVV